MQFPFDLTEDATRDLEEAIGYIAQDNVTAALTVADHLENAFRFLAEWPLAGHHRGDLTLSPEVRFWPTGRYLIVYVPGQSKVRVIAVFHGSRDIAALLPSRLGKL